MASRMHNPPHPGSILQDAIEARGHTDDETAASLGISAPFLRAIYAGEADMTPELAAKIGGFLGTGEELWLRMQANRDEWLRDPRSE